MSTTPYVYRLSNGWRVRMKKNGELVQKSFTDSAHGGREKCYQVALEYRNSIMTGTIKPTKPKTKEKHISRKDGKWCFQLNRMGKYHSVTFNDSKHGGYEGALNAAKAYRDKVLKNNVPVSKPTKQEQPELPAFCPDCGCDLGKVALVLQAIKSVPFAHCPGCGRDVVKLALALHSAAKLDAR